AHRRLESIDSHPVGDDKSAVERRRHVVGMAFELDRQLQYVRVELEQVVGGKQASDDRRRAGPQPTESGMSEEIRNAKASAGCRRSNALTTRLLRSSGTSSEVS